MKETEKAPNDTPEEKPNETATPKKPSEISMDDLIDNASTTEHQRIAPMKSEPLKDPFFK